MWAQAADRLGSVAQLKSDVAALRASGMPTSAEDAAELPERLTLHGAYPNPFNPATTLRFDLPAAARVAVDVYDLLGRRVLALPARPMAAGTGQSLRVDASALPSGTYLYRVTARGAARSWHATGQMILVK